MITAMYGINNGLRDLRERRVLTQEELALASGVAVATISRLETGKVKASKKTVRALAKAFGLSPGELYEVMLERQPPLL